MEESRKRRASSELQMETQITDLPEEILIKIFNFLKQGDLLSLTLQCKQFNQIICDGFMDKIILHVSPKNLEANWVGNRKYTSVSFNRNCTDDNFMDFVNIFARLGMIDYIKTLFMQNVTINPFSLKAILSMCKNLKVLHIPKLTEAKVITVRNENRTSNEPEVYWRHLPSLDLKDLKCYNGCGRTLKLLQSSSTRSFSFTGLQNDDRDFLQNFLKVQEKLEFLDLNCSIYYNNIEFFTTETLDYVKFRLKTLKLKNINTHNIEHFYKFVNNHAETLSHVELYNLSISLLNNFRNVNNIKKLIYVFNSQNQIYDDFDMRENVEELDITISTAFDLAVKFPNLTKIKIQTNSVVGLKLGKFQKLTHLEIKKGCCTIHDLTISASTKFVRFEDYTFAEMPHFEEFHFEDISLINCKNVDWLAEFLEKDETRVKNLTIKSMELSSEVFKVIGKHFWKITNFVIEDIKFL